MSRATCLITGTTHGIGLVTARKVAERGFRVVMACRNAARANDVRTRMVEATGNSDIHVLECDLTSLASVRRCASEFKQRFDTLTLLINNAGTLSGQSRASADGFELTFACNHLGPYLLTRLLLDPLISSQPARIVTVASQVHGSAAARLNSAAATRNAASDFYTAAAEPLASRDYSGMRAYATSKLANVMFTLSLAEQLQDSQVTANCLHPGVVATNIVADTNVFLRSGMKIARYFMLDDERGAATSVYLALSSELEGVSGKYFNEHQRMVDPAPVVLDPAARTALWQISERLCGLASPNSAAAGPGLQ